MVDWSNQNPAQHASSDPGLRPYVRHRDCCVIIGIIEVVGVLSKYSFAYCCVQTDVSCAHSTRIPLVLTPTRYRIRRRFKRMSGVKEHVYPILPTSKVVMHAVNCR